MSKEETQARADVIKAALVSKRVDAGRIEAVGVGGGGARVDFLIIAAPPPPKPPTDAETPQAK